MLIIETLTSNADNKGFDVNFEALCEDLLSCNCLRYAEPQKRNIAKDHNNPRAKRPTNQPHF